MTQVINTNISSLNAQRNLTKSQADLSVAMQRLSSGLRVNSAKDDAAGLAIATRMTAQSNGMAVAIRNANDGISLAQTAEGALGQVKDHLLRMRDLAVQSANGTNTPADRSALGAEFQQLQSEVTRVLRDTQFNGKNVLGAAAGATNFQVGANAGEIVTVTTTKLQSATTFSPVINPAKITIGGAATNTNIASAITAVDTALTAVNSDRATLGAAQSRFDGVISILQIARENQTAAASRIMDTDYAAETARLTRAQVLQQAGTAMLAQANALPNQVLTLLR
jgi:flagellin